jgi:fibronectin type 3 domain-containing protein
MVKTFFGIGLTLIILAFAGCGGGTDSIESILDVRNPQIVRNISAFSAHRRVRIVWDRDTNANVIAYNIYSSVANSGGFKLIGSVGQTATPFFQDEGLDTDGDGIPDGLVNNITHFYKVTALDRTGRETPLSFSSSVSAIPGVLPNETIDLAVEDVRAYAGKQQAFVTWDRLDHEQVFGYNVYRSVSGVSTGFELVAITAVEVNSFIDGGLSPMESYVYQIAPAVSELEDISGKKLTSGLLEGRRSESRAVRPQDSDSTVPKPPGSSPGAPFSVTAAKAVIGGKDGVLLQFTRPTANTDGSILVDQDDLISGAYLVYRSKNIFGHYDLVGILENIGSTPISEFFDAFGSENDFYYLKVGDNFGNLSARSDIASVSAAVPPPTVKNLTATSGQGFGSIIITWTEISGSRLDGYNLYRSEEKDRGFVAVGHNIIDESPDPEIVRFTDSSAALAVGQTYYYKISATANGLESSLSVATAASPGPANGIIVLEGENAVKIDSFLTGPIANRTPAANHPAQFWPPHWTFQRQGFHSPFLGNGALLLTPLNAATSDIVLGERIDLMWRVDVQALVGDAVGGAITADIYLQSADDSTSGQYKILVDDKQISTTLAPGTEPPSGVDSGFDGIQTEINFRDSSFSTPLRPTRRLIGTLRIDHLADFNVPTSPFADTETIYMTLIHSGPAQATGNFGTLKLDALILILR